MAKLF
jgi:hypothetical protein